MCLAGSWGLVAACNLVYTALLIALTFHRLPESDAKVLFHGGDLVSPTQ